MKARLQFFKNRDYVDQQKNNAYKKDIIAQLKVLRMSEQAIDKMLNAIDTMPASTHILGAMKFLTELADKKSVCEDYYLHSDYIAEYFCTLSNLGFFAVAFYYQDYATLFAATFSALSHAIPLKRLNELDKIAAVSIFLKVLFHYDVLMKSPGIVAAGIATFSFGILDMFVGRKNKEIFGPSFHAAWHLAAAFALYQFNQAKIEVAANDVQVLAAAATQNIVPGYLQYFYDVVCENIAKFGNVNRCGII